MTLTTTEAILAIFVMAGVTFLTRLLPFLLFGGNKSIPSVVSYLGKVLPSAVMAMLIIYCLRQVDLFSATHGLREILAVLVVVLLHLWKRNNLLSIFGGTVLYMLLLQSGLL